MKGIYFSEKGAELLEKMGMTKSEFARRMGIQRQNVNALFKTSNLGIIAKVADVLQVPLALLVGYVEEPEVSDISTMDILPEDVPTGDTIEDRRARQEIIKQFYHQWKMNNPELCKFNEDLQECIYINHTSLIETAGQASLTYLSTLAVLQLDAILHNAKVCYTDKPKSNNKNQSKFERMLVMKCVCPGIGQVRLIVGVRRRDKTKIQYCITALTPIFANKIKQPHV